jgi:hypothetical protein
MQPSRFIRALMVVAGLGSISMPAFADDINLDTWYCGRFLTADTDLLGGAFEQLGVCQSVTMGIFEDTEGNIFDVPFYGSPGAAPWTFTVGDLGATLTVVDLQISGDQFELFDDGQLLGRTSDPELGIEDCNFDDPDGSLDALGCVLASPAYSKGMFDLAAGDHSITGNHLGSINFGDFAFIVRSNVVNNVPAPAGIALFALAIGAAVAMRRGSRNRA